MEFVYSEEKFMDNLLDTDEEADLMEKLEKIIPLLPPEEVCPAHTLLHGQSKHRRDRTYFKSDHFQYQSKTVPYPQKIIHLIEFKLKPETWQKKRYRIKN